MNLEKMVRRDEEISVKMEKCPTDKSCLDEYFDLDKRIAARTRQIEQYIERSDFVPDLMARLTIKYNREVRNEQTMVSIKKDIKNEVHNSDVDPSIMNDLAFYLIQNVNVE